MGLRSRKGRTYGQDTENSHKHAASLHERPPFFNPVIEKLAQDQQ
jgi:hypothetical protein